MGVNPKTVVACNLYRGHQMAQQFQQQNPDLVDQMRSQTGGNPGASDKQNSPKGNTLVNPIHPMLQGVNLSYTSYFMGLTPSAINPLNSRC